MYNILTGVHKGCTDYVDVVVRDVGLIGIRIIGSSDRVGTWSLSMIVTGSSAVPVKFCGVISAASVIWREMIYLQAFLAGTKQQNPSLDVLLPLQALRGYI